MNYLIPFNEMNNRRKIDDYIIREINDILLELSDVGFGIQIYKRSDYEIFINIFLGEWGYSFRGPADSPMYMGSIKFEYSKISEVVDRVSDFIKGLPVRLKLEVQKYDFGKTKKCSKVTLKITPSGLFG